MIPSVLIKLILPKLLDKIAHIIKYVEDENVLDIKMKKVERRLKSLESKSHPPIFSKKELTNLKKRITKLENKWRN